MSKKNENIINIFVFKHHKTLTLSHEHYWNLKKMSSPPKLPSYVSPFRSTQPDVKNTLNTPLLYLCVCECIKIVCAAASVIISYGMFNLKLFWKGQTHIKEWVAVTEYIAMRLSNSLDDVFTNVKKSIPTRLSTA